MTENLSGMTIGRLKEIISNIDDSVEIGIWDNLGLIANIEIEVTTTIFDEPVVDINIDGDYPYQKGDKMDITRLTTKELENLKDEINNEIRERRRVKQQEVILLFKEAFKALENEHIDIYFDYGDDECIVHLEDFHFEEAF